jgi:hypothetical protein
VASERHATERMRFLRRLGGALTRRLSPPPPALLRQTDWRFLLPNPEGQSWDHVVLLGGSPELARLITERGIAKRVTTEIPRERCADVVVVLRREVRSLERAVSCLLPGGALYAEMRSFRVPSSPRSPSRIDRSLRDLGLAQVRTYWIRPSLARREAYLPLDGSGPVSWYFENVLSERNLHRRLAGTWLRLATKLGSRLRQHLVIDSAVTAVAREDAAPPSLLGHPGLPSRLRSPGERLLLLTGGAAREIYRRVVLLPFGPEAGEPELVIKLWRSPDRNVDSANEQSTLAAIRSSRVGVESQFVPAPLGLFQWGPLSVGVESYCRGRSFAISNSGWRPRRRKVDDLKHVMGGFAEFYGRAVIRREPWSASDMSERVEGVLQRYEAELLTTSGERRLFESVRSRSESLRGDSLPIVWSHPDLGPSNVLIRSDGITIIDWAKAAPGLPLLDVLYFVLISCFAICAARDETGRLEVFRRLFLESNPGDRLAVVVQGGIDRCLDSMGADRRFFPILLVLLWTSRSVGRLERSRAVARGEEGINPKVGNPYPSYVKALGESSDGLFRRFSTPVDASSRPFIDPSERFGSKAISL